MALCCVQSVFDFLALLAHNQQGCSVAPHFLPVYNATAQVVQSFSLCCVPCDAFSNLGPSVSQSSDIIRQHCVDYGSLCNLLVPV